LVGIIFGWLPTLLLGLWHVGFLGRLFPLFRNRSFGFRRGVVDEPNCEQQNQQQGG
jgi:hypothetical protein